MRIDLGTERDSGAVAVFVAILAVVLIGASALAVDVAQAYAVKRQLSVSADAAALAAVSEAQKSIPPGSPCPTGTELASMRAAASSAATAILTANRLPPEATVTVETNCNGTSPVESEVRVIQPISSILGGVFGVTETNPSRSATARAFPASVASGLRPFAICDTVVTQAAQAPSGSVSHFNGNRRTGVCGTNGNGNWGIADFTDGSAPQNVLRDWTVNGYPGAVTIPDRNMDAQPGNRFSNLSSSNSFDGMVGKTALLPVATRYVGNANSCGGTGCSLDTVAFMAAEICGVWVPKGGSGNYDKFTTSGCYSAPAATAWSLDPANANAAFIQFRYVDRITTSYVGGTPQCTFGTSCDRGVRTIQLFK